jgi:hypothetical protein
MSIASLPRSSLYVPGKRAASTLAAAGDERLALMPLVDPTVIRHAHKTLALAARGPA